MTTYKDLADRIDRDSLVDFYSGHLPTETCEHFGIPSRFLLKRLLEYYNIPAHTPAENTRIQFARMSPDARVQRSRKISESEKGHPTPAATRLKISETQRGKPRPSSKKSPTRWQKGHIPWNKGKKGVQVWTDGQAERRWNTLKARNKIGQFKTGIEARVERFLIDLYGQDHVHYQYKDRLRYPFYCDFYVDSVDLFVEVNNWWHHGPHPFNPQSQDDLTILKNAENIIKNDPNKLNVLSLLGYGPS